jgi:hypothetical protein
MKHTPGPWEYYDNATERGLNGITGISYSVCSNKHVDDRFYLICNTTDGFKQAEADARLIAAAPELLEACKEALSVMKRYADVPVHILALEKAIAKAEGGTL